MPNIFRCMFALFLMPLWAQMPSEALLVINGSSPHATEIANEYAALRGFPDERILVLTPPVSLFQTEGGSSRWTVSEAEARQHVLDPVLLRVEALSDASPTVLILSPDWPTRVSVSGSPEVSITGFLGSRGHLPGGDLIKTGRAVSPWFAPPPDTPQNSKRLLRYPTPGNLPDDFFLPAAMLGVFYAPMDTDKIIQQLKRAKSGDFQQPVGAIVFETKEDVRTKTRMPQYNAAKSRLDQRDIDTHLLTAADPLPDRILGVMAGAASVNTRRYASRLVPGSFADHLTSFAATFDNAHQTKITEWLDAGAAASIGTVTEPYSVWTKFPEAAFFERYLKGHTLLEALMQSLASPFQTLLLGDPLCTPWSRELTDLQLKTAWEGAELRISASGVPLGGATHLHLFVDGTRVEGNGPSWTIPTDAENTGPELNLLLHARYLWAPPELGVVRKRIGTPHPEKLSLSASRKGDDIQITARSKEELVHWELYQGGRRLHSGGTKGKKHQIRLPVTHVGTGPITLRAKGVTRQGRILLSNYEDADFRL
ncbi:MAG: hypothetical protein WD708_11080 [Kiritimatiellia bacterium]